MEIRRYRDLSPLGKAAEDFWAAIMSPKLGRTNDRSGHCCRGSLRVPTDLAKSRKQSSLDTR